MPETIPTELRKFISAHFRSVEQLEILLLLHGTPAMAWSVQEVYDVILSSKASVQRWLEDFVRMGFVEVTTEAQPRYHFAAAPEIASRIDALNELYKVKPARVIEAIFKRDRDPAQSFADAFKIKKKP